jgi:hypothetical protein
MESWRNNMEEDKFISGEQYQATKTKKPTKNSGPNNKIVLIVIAILAYSVIIFYIGIAYQKHHNKTPVAANKTTNGQFGGQFGGRGGSFANRLFGSVTAVSPTSITVTNSRTNSSTTVTINSTTTITNNQQTVSVSSITVGEEVMIALDPSNTSVATSITVVNLQSPSPGSQT